MADADREIRGWGGGGGGGMGGAGGVGGLVGVGCGSGLQKNLFRPFGPQFGLEIRGTPGPLPARIRLCICSS